MNKINWELNTITGGNYNPFVYRDDAGVHIGDCDNHEIFATVAEARKYARGARLSGGALSKSRHHANADYRDNYAAEYHWHQDAGLQLDALDKLDKLVDAKARALALTTAPGGSGL